MVTTDHNPIDIVDKKVEFDHAKYGTIGLESAFGALQTVFTTKKAVSLLTQGKARFGVPESSINIGEVANLSLFNPDGKYQFSKENITSKSKNSAFLGMELKGNVYGVISNNKVVLKKI